MLKNMEYVYAVYQKKSFSKAAESLHISQPALSTAIRKIESKIQLPLFDRSSTPIELTAAGRIYIDSIEQIMALEQDMAQRFSQLVLEQRTTINVGTSSFFCSYILPQLAEAFREEHPDVVINLMEANSSEFSGLFHSDILDLCLTVDQLEDTLPCTVWKQEEIILAVPASFSVPQCCSDSALTFEQIRSGRYQDKDIPCVGLDQFREIPFLFLKPGNDLHQRADLMCQRAGFTPNVTMYLDQLLTSYYVACSGKGAAFIRPDLVRHVEPTSTLQFFKLEDPLAQRDIRLYHRPANLSPIARQFRDFLLEHDGSGLSN